MEINAIFEEQFFLDINWYFVDPFKRLCVVASGGGLLPFFLLEQNNQNDEFHNIVFDLPERFNSGRNENVIASVVGLTDDNLQQYFRDFDSLAKKGFFVYDKINLNNPEDSEYLLVTYPIYDTRKDPFPINPTNLDLIPRIKSTLISRTNDSFSETNFEPINLVTLINNEKQE